VEDVVSGTAQTLNRGVIKKKINLVKPMKSRGFHLEMNPVLSTNRISILNANASVGAHKRRSDFFP